MDFGEIDILKFDIGRFERLREGAFGAFECKEITARHGQKIIHMLRCAHGHGFREGRRVFVGREDQGRGTICYQRAIGQPQRRRDLGVHLGHGAAMFEGELFMHMCQRVGHGVGVVLHRNLRHRVQRAAIARIIVACGHAEDLRKAQRRLCWIVLVSRTGQRLRDLFGTAAGHLFRANDKHRARLPRADHVHPRMDRGRA